MKGVHWNQGDQIGQKNGQEPFLIETIFPILYLQLLQKMPGGVA
jgi:hypothetical protein